MVSVSDITGMTGGLGLGLESIGLAGSIYSGFQEAGYEKQIAEQSELQASDEFQLNQLRQQQMNLFGKRQEMENLRNTQRMRAQGISSAVGSGAQYGSGTGGAQGQAAASGAQGTRNISQNLQLGNQMFDLTGQIDMSKMTQASLGAGMAQWQGIGSIFGGGMGLGQGFVQSSTQLGNMFGS